jgi:single-strand DNA-binding protein
MDLNRAMIIGNVTRDPELRTTTTGRSVCSFGVATNRTWNDDAGQKQQQVEFHSVVAWGKLAEICSQFLAKGRRVYIEGRLQTRDWQAQDGAKRQRTEIIAENMIMLDRTGAPGAGGSSSASSGDTGAPSTPAPTEEIQIEDIPF